MKMTKVLSLLLVVCMMLAALVACVDKESQETGNGTGTAGSSEQQPATTTPEQKVDPTTLDDEGMYDYIFAEFLAAYDAAKAVSNMSERFALMAIAEAKLLETGTLVPVQANGGNYAISKVAPYTITPVLYGSDSDRYHNALVATTPILPADRDALKALYAEKRGTGTYEAEARAYLESKGYEIKRTYTINYSSDPRVLDVLRTSRQTDSAVLVNLYDGLVEYNGENELMPALATEWSKTLNDDGTATWTFKIRQGVKWVNSNGEELAELTADDFVAGFQHMLDDPTEQLSWLVSDKVVGAEDYVHNNGDFEDVAVVAVDDYTLTYTLIEDVPYFEAMLSYSTFAPLCRSYYESLGGQFGFGNDDSGTYASDKDHLAYCGPYILTNLTAQTTAVFDKNESYWNKDNINLDKITWIYVNLQQDRTRAYQNFADGLVDGSGLNSAALEKAKEDGNFEKYAYVSSPDATCFPGFLNVNRGQFEAPTNAGEMVSTQNDEMKARTHAAMLNQNFRMALATSLDRTKYMAANVGDDLKYASMGNLYTVGNFVALTEETTVKINGEDKTYPAGTYYGEVVQDQLKADGFPMIVWDPEQESGMGSSSGFDGWLNVEASKQFLAKAVAELAEFGIEVSAENPIHIDFAYINDGSVGTAGANVVKASIEEAAGGLIIVDLLGADTQEIYNDSTYDFEDPADANYDLQLNSGWGPDYGDPSTFLDTMLKGGGYMLKCLGLGV